MNKKTELVSLREVLGGAADLLLVLAWETFLCGPPFAPWIYVKPGDVSAESMKTARRKLLDYGLIRTEFHPGRGYAYQMVDAEGLEMLIPAFEQWHQERKAARFREHPTARAAKRGVAA